MSAGVLGEKVREGEQELKRGRRLREGNIMRKKTEKIDR